MERYPPHAVAKWLGHSPKVAAEHYLMSREHHFEDVVGGGRGPTAAERSSWVFGVLGVGLRCAEMCSGRLWVRWWLRSTSVRAISLKVGWMTRQEPLQLRLRPLVRLPIARRFIVGQPTLSFTIAARLLKAPFRELYSCAPPFSTAATRSPRRPPPPDQVHGAFRPTSLAPPVGHVAIDDRLRVVLKR